MQELKEQYTPSGYIYNNRILSGGNRFYSLIEKVKIKDESYFYLKYKSENSFILSLNGMEFPIPGSDKLITYCITLFKNIEIRSFSITTQFENNETDQLFECGIIPIEEDIDLDSKTALIILKENELLLSFSPLEHMRSINLIFESNENSTTSNIIMKAGDSIEYSIKSRRGYNSYWIYGNIVDPPLNNLSIITVNTPLVKVFFQQDYEDGNALPVDLEEFINWKFDLWRQKDYEVFQWDLFPDIFLIDTESYDIQSKFFKRLAFFTEKKMAVGELLSDEELKPLHGWNAHDYKADDLARFFNEADTLGIILNEYELLLKEILLENQVLKITSGRVRPLKGGILSISRESNARLRWLFLTHESYHGIFFSSKEYESAVFEIWNNLPEEQKDFWRIFLDLYGYNINDEYLLINEFQAYLMQQDTSLTDSYFRSKIEWMISIRPYLKKQLENRNTFFKNALAVEESAYSLLGIKAGDLVLKRKK